MTLAATYLQVLGIVIFMLLFPSDHIQEAAAITLDSTLRGSEKVHNLPRVPVPELGLKQFHLTCRLELSHRPTNCPYLLQSQVKRNNNKTHPPCIIHAWRINGMLAACGSGEFCLGLDRAYVASAPSRALLMKD